MVNWFRKKDTDTGEHILRCPRDRTEMRKIKKRDVVLDVCPVCGGMWVDAGEIQKLQTRRKK